MNSINFPKMFRGNSTIVAEGNEAVRNDLHLLLSSENGEFLFDPGWGIKLKKFTFNQNNYVLRDILIDEIYTKITTFFPQLVLTRKNIVIKQDGKKLFAEITTKNLINFKTNTYSLQIFEQEGDE